MKTFRTSLLLLALALTATSCEKVIDLDLETAETQTVIEAVLDADQTTFQVTISETSDYFNPEIPAAVSGAQVTLTDDQGGSWTLTEAAAGLYATEVTPETGRTYTLEVSTESGSYQASSTLLPAVELLAIDTEFEEANAFFDEGYNAYLRFEDDGTAANFYRIKHSINQVAQNGGDDLQVVDDNLFDGNLARLPIFQQIFNPGDVLEVTLVHFDEPSFDYWSTLADIVSAAGGPNGAVAAPANPDSNWSGGALGYFSCQASSTLEIVLPE